MPVGSTLQGDPGRTGLTWGGCRAQNQNDSSYNEINEDTHAGENNNGSCPGQLRPAHWTGGVPD